MSGTFNDVMFEYYRAEERSERLFGGSPDEDGMRSADAEFPDIDRLG